MATTHLPIVTDQRAMGPVLDAMELLRAQADGGDVKAERRLAEIAALYHADRALEILHSVKRNGHVLISLTIRPTPALLELLGLPPTPAQAGASA